MTATPFFAALLATATAPSAAALADRIATPADPVATVLEAEKSLRVALASGATRDDLSRVAAAYVDYRELARRSSGSAWGRMSPRDQDAVVRALRALLEETYVPGLAPSGGWTVTARLVRRRGGQARVAVVAAAGGKQAPLELDLLRDRSGRWQIYDAVVSGLAILEGYQEQFPQLLALGGVPRLIAQLEQERAALVARRAAAPTRAPRSGAERVRRRSATS